jgi:hypothetical protein
MQSVRNGLFLVFCLCGSATASLGQQTSPALTPSVGAEIRTQRVATPAAIVPQDRPSFPEPVYIINGRYIGNADALGKINPQQIAKIEIYKQGQGPAQWRSLTTPGIVSLTLKAKPNVKWKAKSLSAIKRRLRLHGPVQFELNGASIQDESLQIVTEAVAGFDVTRATPDTAAKTVVNIRLVPYKPAPHSYPPGTIMIRGLARQ